MTQAKILSIYKLSSLVTLIVSAVLAIFFIDAPIWLSVGIGIMINLQFHFAYQFLSRVPIEMYRHGEKLKPESKTLALKLFRFFSWIAMIFSAIGFVGLLIIAFREPQALVGLMTLIAVFLGGYSSVVKLSKD